MPNRLLATCFTLVGLLSCLQAPAVDAGQPQWVPNVVATGNLRAKIQHTPIAKRPGRPLHVYGNTIRMMQQNERVTQYRPLRHIFFGTPELRVIAEYYRK
jgi:hypothetical protein